MQHLSNIDTDLEYKEDYSTIIFEIRFEISLIVDRTIEFTVVLLLFNVNTKWN